MSEGEVKEVQGHAISVYGNVAMLVEFSDSTLNYAVVSRRLVERAMRSKLALFDCLFETSIAGSD